MYFVYSQRIIRSNANNGKMKKNIIKNTFAENVFLYISFFRVERIRQ